MIFNDLFAAFLARLRTDAYFSEPNFPLTIVGEGPLNTGGELDAALGQYGVAGVLAMRKLQIGPHAQPLAMVTFTLDFVELPLVTTDGPYAIANPKRALMAAVKAMSLFSDWSPNDNMWDKLWFSGLELTEADRKTGQIKYSMTFTTKTFLGTEVFVLATQDGNPLETEDGRHLLVSPTLP